MSEKKKKKPKFSNAWAEARELMWKHRRRLSIGMALMLASRLAGLVLPLSSRSFVDKVVNDIDQPVALFALEWCEFCWSVRKLFARLDIPYRSIDLDSVAYQEGERGKIDRSKWLTCEHVKSTEYVLCEGIKVDLQFAQKNFLYTSATA